MRIQPADTLIEAWQYTQNRKSNGNCEKMNVAQVARHVVICYRAFENKYTMLGLRKMSIKEKLRNREKKISH